MKIWIKFFIFRDVSVEISERKTRKNVLIALSIPQTTQSRRQKRSYHSIGKKQYLNGGRTGSKMEKKVPTKHNKDYHNDDEDYDITDQLTYENPHTTTSSPPGNPKDDGGS